MDRITVRDAEREYEELSLVIDHAERVRPRWTQLGEFLAMAERLLHAPGEIDPSGIPTALSGEESLHSEKLISSLSIADAAELALKSEKKGIHLSALTERMHAMGWTGSGETKRDMESVRKSLRRKPGKFKNLGNNTWKLTDSVELRPSQRAAL